MDNIGNDLSSGGQVLSIQELSKKRVRNGQCPTCGQKCFKKKLFKLEAITLSGKVLDGRCLQCNPQDPSRGDQLVAVATFAPAPAAPPSRQRGRVGGMGRSTRNQGVAASMPGTAATRSAVNSATTSFRQASLSNISEQTDSRSSYGSRSNAAPSSPKNGSTSARFPSSTSPASPPRPRHSQSQRIGYEQRGSSGRDLDQRPQFARRDSSKRTGDFMSRQTPRPSAVFLEGINIEDLFKDEQFSDSDDDDNNNDNNNNSNDMSPSTMARRLSTEERKALQFLKDESNSFLDIVNMMLMNSLSAPIQNEGLHALSLAHDPDVRLLEECAGSCGFEVIVSAMGKCSKDAMAQTNACKVLFIASASGEEIQTAIGDAGGIDALVDAMKEFEDDVIVLEGCLLALSNLCIPEQNLSYAIEGELIEVAVNALSTNVENCGLQEHGCGVIANLAVHEEARGRIRSCGGCDTVVMSMVVNPMDVGVQCQALVALRNLCVGDDENKVLLANVGGIDVVIQAMQSHKDDSEVQSRGSWVLGVIGMNEDNKLYIGQNGGSDVIIRSMWAFPNDREVQEKACRALWTLSVHPDNRYSMVEVDAISAIIAAMRNHAGEPNIQERGCGAMCNLAANNDDLKIQIVDEGALEVIVMAMVLHGENEMIQERAVALLFKLCIEENIVKMVNANVSPMMAVVADNFPICQEKAAYVLQHLS